MEQFQLVVNLPPDDVMTRLAASIDQPRLVVINPFSGKDFFGYLDGYQFWIRKRQRWSRNSFAPACNGGVVPNGSGSTINCSIAAKYTFLWIFGGIFLLLSLLFSVVIGLMGFMAGPPDSKSMIPSLLVAFGIPLFVVVFFAGFFFISKLMGKGNERALSYFVQGLFRDVMVQPA
jgi:hypothetical protein